MTAETLFDFYLDVNILLLVAAFAWWAFSACLKRGWIRSCPQTELRASYALLVAVPAFPLTLLVIEQIDGAAYIATLSMLSLSDFAVAQFLDGRIGMSPMAFETTLNMRGELVRDIVGLRTHLGQAITLVLSVGVGISIIRQLRAAFRIRGMLSESFVLRRHKRLRLLVSEKATVPFSTRSLWRYFVVVPVDFLIRPGDLRIAVSHELQHIRQRDITWEIILEFIRPFFFWNPAYYYWKQEIECRRELACDRRLVSRELVTLSAYSDCLLRACERAVQSKGGQQLTSPAVPFVHSAGRHAGRLLTTRFEMLVQPVHPQGATCLATISGAVIAFVLLSGVAISASSEWSHDRIMLSTIVNLERLDSRTFAEVDW